MKINNLKIIFLSILVLVIFAFLIIKFEYESFFLVIDFMIIIILLWFLNKKNRLFSNLSIMLVAIILYFEMPQIVSVFFDERGLKLGILFQDINTITLYWILKLQLYFILLIFVIILPNEKEIVVSNFEIKNIKRLAFILMLLGTFVSILKYRKMGGIFSLLSMSYLNSMIASFGLGMYSAGGKIAIIGIFLYFYYLVKKPKEVKVKVIDVCIVLSALFFNVFIDFYTGSRNPIFLLVIMLITLLKNINFKKYIFTIAIIIFVIYIALASYSEIRYYRGINMSWKEAMIQTFVSLNFNEILPTNTEFGYAPAITYLLIENENNRFYGKTLLHDVANAIPKASNIFNIEVPSVWFVKKYFPDVYYRGGALGFSFLGEAYINFGIAFAFLFFVPILYIIYLIDYRSSKKWFNELVATAMLPNTFLLLRSPVSRFVLEGIIISAIIPSIIYFVVKAFKKKAKH